MYGIVLLLNTDHVSACTLEEVSHALIRRREVFGYIASNLLFNHAPVLWRKGLLYIDRLHFLCLLVLLYI